ncbi:MAG: formylglycine-generating enzyme family protein [Bacteroidota bacterium]
MKKLLFIFFAICTHVVAQQKKEIKPGERLKLNGKKFNYVSTGKENLYAYKNEISNLNYLEFLYYIRKTKGEAEYQKNLPDTLVWRSTRSGFAEKYVNHYLRHPIYLNYPVVGISYEQAENYCHWITELMNNHYHDKKIKKIRFRLPTEEEWELAARGGLPEGTIYPWGTKSTKMEKGKFKGEELARFKGSETYTIQGLSIIDRMRGFFYSRDMEGTLCSVDSYWPNNYGLYNMSGNVAEMVAEKSICKGGAWNQEPYKMVISSRDTFYAETPWVGFRVFAEIDEYHDKSRKIKH